nr:class I SAM-dependent methyltransferase [uncultured Cohaesibacter sp.]
MNSITYSDLANLNRKPEPFSKYTTDALWTDPWIAGQMLRNHLDQDTDLASRRGETIAGIVSWFERKISLSGKSVCDLGCGPGLYAEHMAERGAQVTGVDFSADHARTAAKSRDLPIEYWRADYLKDALPGDQDIVTLIYGDFCTLSPDNRHRLLTKIKAMLKPGGVLVFDVFTTPQFWSREESATYGHRPMGDFWSPEDHFGFHTTFLYEQEKLALDRFMIVGPNCRFEIFNWMQYFGPQTTSGEVEQAGLNVLEAVSALTGEPWLPVTYQLKMLQFVRMTGMGKQASWKSSLPKVSKWDRTEIVVALRPAFAA